MIVRGLLLYSCVSTSNVLNIAPLICATLRSNIVIPISTMWPGGEYYSCLYSNIFTIATHLYTTQLFVQCDWGSIAIVSQVSSLMFSPLQPTMILNIRGGGMIGYVKSKHLGNGQIISLDVLVIMMIIPVFHKKLILPPVRALSKLKRHLLDLTL